jgi:hypothetical protein
MKRTAWSGLSGKENNATVDFVPVGWLHPFEYIISLIKMVRREQLWICSRQTYMDDTEDVQSLTLILMNTLIIIVKT